MSRKSSVCSGHLAAHGFTLIELMITIAVMAVLVVLAVPNFRALMISNQLTTASNEIVAALNLAKLEAIKRNARTQFCSNASSGTGGNTTDTLGSACGTSAGAVNVLTGGTPSTATVRDAVVGIQDAIKLNGTLVAVRFSGSGIGYAPGTTSPPLSVNVSDICSSAISKDNHRIVAITTGTIISSTTSTGACP